MGGTCNTLVGAPQVGVSLVGAQGAIANTGNHEGLPLQPYVRAALERGAAKSAPNRTVLPFS